MRLFLLIAGFLILLLIEVGRVYFIMPFPGSQQADTIDIAYFIQSHLGLMRLVGVVLIAWPLNYYLLRGSRAQKISVGVVLLIYIVIFYLFNFRFLAEKMFYQPTQTVFLDDEKSTIGQHQLVLGVTINGESKAYPIEIIGYHHQVRDIIGGQQVMVTYCTVCRTGRVFSPTVDGKTETFRLVGMDHFNAMFEDKTTKSWWRQVSGEAIAGPLKGTVLTEIPSEQLKLSEWVAEHPQTAIMQEDATFHDEYVGMRNYDEGKSKGDLTRHDTASWKEKSWVVGLTIADDSRAYDWNDLTSTHVLNDVLNATPVAVVLQDDSVSFHVWTRIVGIDTLTFMYDTSVKKMRDDKTGSLWDWSGNCIEGTLKGTKVRSLQSYQEFWHSWRTFHPRTTKFDPAKAKQPKGSV